MTKEEKKDILHRNSVLFSLREDYKKVIKEKCKDMLKQCYAVASSVKNSKRYNIECEKLAVCLNDYLRTLSFDNYLLEEIKDNLDILSKGSLNYGTGKKSN